MRTEMSHPCISSSYTPGYCSITLLINNTSCAVNDKRRSMSSTACSFIYADLCDSFFAYRPFVLLSRPDWVINRRGISVFFPNFLHKCQPQFQKSCYNDSAQPLHEQKHQTPTYINLKNKKQPCRPNRLHSCHHIFENKSGIPITPYKEHMIHRSETPNARLSFLFEGRVSMNRW